MFASIPLTKAPIRRKSNKYGVEYWIINVCVGVGGCLCIFVGRLVCVCVCEGIQLDHRCDITYFAFTYIYIYIYMPSRLIHLTSDLT